MSIEKFLIGNDVIETAQNICSDILDSSERSRAVANIVASKCAVTYFEKLGIEADDATGLHNIPLVLKDIEISDIYLDIAYVDVRLCSNENELCVPASHFKNNLLPSVYMFIKIEEDLSSYEVLGFVLPEGIEKDNEQNGYFMLNSDLLLPFDEISEYIEAYTDENNVSDSDIFKYFENSLDDKMDFLRKLIHSKDSRQKFIQYYNAQNVFNFVSANYSVDYHENVTTEDTADDERRLSSYDYTTVATPRLDNSYENSADNSDNLEVFSELENPNDNQSIVSDNTESVGKNYQELETLEGSDIVENLFTPNEQTTNQDEDYVYSSDDFDINAIRAKQKRKPLLILLILVIAVALAGVGGYFLFININGSNESSLPALNKETLQEPSSFENKENADLDKENNTKDEAMPVESVEATPQKVNTNEGNAVQIPEIERSLDASVLVSNLKIDWEVPIGYASNTAATRYFIKLGKIIQLNLKTELLLLNKPPLSNKIAVEMKYNSSEKQFDVEGITISSGEKTIDDLIVQTVKKALKMKLSSNMDSFGKISGNPVLVIRL